MLPSFRIAGDFRRGERGRLLALWPAAPVAAHGSEWRRCPPSGSAAIDGISPAEGLVRRHGDLEPTIPLSSTRAIYRRPGLHSARSTPLVRRVAETGPASPCPAIWWHIAQRCCEQLRPGCRSGLLRARRCDKHDDTDRPTCAQTASFAFPATRAALRQTRSTFKHSSSGSPAFCEF